MGLFSPWFLAGLVAVGLPIWLHLLKRASTEPKPFPSLMFFEHREATTVHKRLDFILLFILRTLMLVLLALLFANPFIRTSTPIGRGERLVVVAVDRSFSMRTSEGAGGSRLEQAKNEALSVIGSIPPNTKAQVVALAGTLQAMTQQVTDLGELRVAVAAIEPSDSRASFGELARYLRTLRESADMPIEAQTRLLRVLQEGEFTTVGGRTPIRADVRIVAATHRNLRQLVSRGQFREDLFYRLNVVPIRLPPLRERVEDIPDLAKHFLARAGADGFGYKTLDRGAMDRLRRHDWPGNVRELENLVRRVAALYSDDIINLEMVESALKETNPAATDRQEGLSEAVERHLSQYFAAHRGALPAAGLYDRILREIERPLLSLALNATRGNQIKAAYLLGINRNTLRKKIRDLDIEITRGVK